MTEFSGAVSGVGQYGGQYDGTIVGSASRALDQISMPLPADRRLFPLDLQNAQQRFLERGVAGQHTPDVAVHCVIVQTRLAINQDGPGEMVH